MQTDQEIRDVVRQKYTEIVRQAEAEKGGSCCGSGSSCGCGCGSDVTVMAEDYARLEGYVPDADLGLGCGVPTEIAAIKSGDVVLDLGSGAGNDVFVARRIVGEEGRVIGVDMTEAMVEKAKANNRKLGYQNVEFRVGEIENLPVESGSIDVVISNCVLNLVPDKARAFAEIHRVLKTGGHFSISDIVTTADLPPAVRTAAEVYAGCVGGALKKGEYLELFRRAGFRSVSMKKEREIHVPDAIFAGVLSPSELRSFRESNAAILSITVYGEK